MLYRKAILAFGMGEEAGAGWSVTTGDLEKAVRGLKVSLALMVLYLSPVK